MEQNNSRETWSSKLGFVLACIGSAIGLGNIWMFPWRLGQFGGAAFLIPYLLFVFVLGTTGLMGEFAFGRSQQRGAIGAFEKVFKEKKLSGGTLIGTIPVVAQTGVFIFYSVVVGWVLRFFVFALKNEFPTMDINTAFENFAGHTESVGWTIGAILITLCIVTLGVKSGIEKVNKVIMPALFGIFIMLMINTLLLKGSMEGVKYLLLPDWSYLLRIDTWVMALGQAFFTVSLGGAGMVVLGSYLPKDMDIPSSAFSTALFDTLAALMAAFIIIPAAFAFDLDPGAGPQLLFITMPRVFNMMGGGYVFGILFFLCLVFAAISTEIVLMEVAVEAFMDKFGIKRTSSAMLTAFIGSIAAGLLSTNMEWFGKFADVVTIYLLPFSALLGAIAFFWIYGIDRARNEVNMGAKIKMVKGWEILAKYIFVFTATAVLVLGILYGGIG
ncbi:sodium-dependent transporter [Anaeromicrobium sediminis]|uniref:Sodium-dependent transporter n=1 Tax=Anaeromicrobium sediminis TaxID=1478221 RepID=A0A267MDN6_9FIRM|nr:sodium-dependent transporter [Anaeromicrobium sediminis]PAB57048.1 sodium-dependent transporter [Anaeromicrobium sediminis]